MKKIIIPRKDHEVYFIPMRENIKSKSLRPFVLEELEKLHPSFEAASVFDISLFEFGKASWIMVTVMDGDVFAEYKILHKNAVFYTNTSIIVRKNNFISCGINIIDDEKIGFDPERNEPVSVPLEKERVDDKQILKAELRKLPLWYGVFNKKNPFNHPTVIALCFFLAASAVFLFIHAGKNAEDAELQDAATTTEEIIVEKHLPGAIEILERISIDVVNAGGKMMSWQYSDTNDPLIEIKMFGLDILKIHEICNQYEFARLKDIENVSYNAGEPFINVRLNAERAGYARINTGVFPIQSISIPIIAELSKLLRREEISIVSEELPAASNGSCNYTIKYSSKDINLIRSLEIFLDVGAKNFLKVNKLDVSIGNGNNSFNVICSLSPCDIPNYDFLALGSEKEKIPAAFGYKESPPIRSSQPEKAPEKNAKPEVVGSIKDSSGQVVFFHNDGSGKIKLR